MADYVRAAGLPRPLTQIFNDNKRLYEELVQTRSSSPVSSPLFLKLRIQKDRLIAWGIQWADRSREDDIDSSLGRAGINDLVASIMDSIKALLEEAESLNPAAQPLPATIGEKSRGKLPMQTHSPESIRRLQEINRDLTTSIDTLCDLSRTRLEPPTDSKAHDKALKEGVRQYVDEKARRIAADSLAESKSLEMDSDAGLTDLTFIESSLFHTAAPMRPSHNAPPSYESIAAGSEDRLVAYFNVPKATAGERPGDVPVLLDYRRSESNVPHEQLRPDNARYEKLLLALLNSPTGQSEEYTGFLRLAGWTHDAVRSRYAFVYNLPGKGTLDPRARQPAHPRSLLSFLQNGGDAESLNVPCLEHRFRLATNIALSISSLHELGVCHGNVNSNNVVFFLDQQMAISQDRIWKGPLLRTPYLIGFHHLGYLASQAERDSPLTGIYYPPSTNVGRDQPFDMTHDLYGLGLVLLEIGLWMPIGKFMKSKYSREDFRSRLQNIYLKKLAHKCGTGYMRAVYHCMTAADDSARAGADQNPTESRAQGLAAFREKVLGVLERCCLMDSDQGPVPLKDSVMATPARERFATSTTTTTTTTTVSAVDTTPARASMARGSQRTSATEAAQQAVASQQSAAEEPSLRSCITVWSHEIPSLYSNYWQKNMYPKLEKILRRAISRWETYSIDLFMAGEDEETARPTLYMECTSTRKVRRILQHLNKDLRLFDIKVVSGQIVRSKARKRKNAKLPRNHTDDFTNLNPHYQEKPLGGASIGAYLRGNHLPPVSFGGTVLVDGEPFGMSVHHMLEDEEEMELELEDVISLQRSMAPQNDSTTSLQRQTSSLSLLTSTVDDDASSVRSGGSQAGSEEEDEGEWGPDNMYPFQIQDTPLYDDALDVDDHDDDFWLDPNFDPDSIPDDQEDEADMGDTSGINLGNGEDLFVTQPALDDVGSGFFPNEEDKDLEHLCSHALGHVHASSGLRRARHEDLIHEIDWALIKINDHRLADPDSVVRMTPEQRAATPTGTDELQAAKKLAAAAAATAGTAALVSSMDLANRAVHCYGRTSGFATGTILPAMRMVRMPGRVSPSHSWQVRGRFGPGGDSGAWVIDSSTGGVCGHVLAYSEASGVAYIAPMDVLLNDMQRTLGKPVALPGAQSSQTSTPDASVCLRADGGLPTSSASAATPDEKRVSMASTTTTITATPAASTGTKVEPISRSSQYASSGGSGGSVRSVQSRGNRVQSLHIGSPMSCGDSRVQAQC